MDWTVAVSNPQSLAQLPSDIGARPIDLHEVILHRDGPRVRLRFDVDAVPNPLPARWGGDANRTQLQLACFGISAFTLSGFATTMSGRLAMRPAGGAWDVEFRVDDVVLALRTSMVRVESLSGYYDPGEAA
ncbi:Imm50 family immunity protein [Pseudoxanthomonas sp. LjRoot143]|uniref:Imm50 family immunity protein n=1 Tax=Pseudoxanthomonas sp. LjRoot143 TaxID=3342266 RepID=UPI003ED14867